MQFKIKHFIKSLVIIIIVSICIIFTSIFILREFIYPKIHFDIITIEAGKNNIDPYLILAIIKNESNFNTLATSKKDAKGLMQIMDSTAKDINNNPNINLYDERINISLGCKYFTRLVNRYNGNYYIAICAYNAGLGNVDKWISEGIIKSDLDEYKNVDIPFSETKKYLNKVISTYKIYRALYG